MNKRIVVGLDGSNYSKAAIEIACQQAQINEGTAVGIGVVDLPGIESIERGAPVGAIYFAEKAEKHKLQDALKKVKGFITDFENICTSKGVKYEVHSTEGVPFEKIVEAGKMADLIIVGLKTYYHFETSSEAGNTVKRILTHSVCPVLAVPETLTFPENIIIAYDGSIVSAKALKTFTKQFSPTTGQHHIYILTISDDKQKADSIQKEALDYLECWDVEPDTIIEDGKPKDVIQKYSEELKPSMVVIGAYGKSKITDFFFGSTAQKLIETCSVPIFIHH